MFYNLNNNIKYLRKKSNRTLKKLASELGITAQSLNNVEGGRKNTSIEVLDKLHNIFEISLDDLIYNDLSKEEV